MTTWTKDPKTSTTYTKDESPNHGAFLLLESGGYMLQENGARILLEIAQTFTKIAKNIVSFAKEIKNAVSFSKDSKPATSWVKEPK